MKKVLTTITIIAIILLVTRAIGLWPIWALRLELLIKAAVLR